MSGSPARDDVPSVRAQRHRLAIRGLLGAMALSALMPGAWAWAAPHGFYERFPGVAHWVALYPPYNEHLVLDVGAFFLAFGLLLAWAALRPTRALVSAACWAWALFGLLHLLFHVTHLDHFSGADAVAQMLSLAGSLGLALAVLWLSRAD